MSRHLGIRIALVAVIVAVSLWYLYPPRKTINLGLDLQGGIHLVLGVDVDKALEAHVERAGDTVRAELQKKGITVSKTERHGPGELVVQLPSAQSWEAALQTGGEGRPACPPSESNCIHDLPRATLPPTSQRGPNHASWPPTSPEPPVPRARYSIGADQARAVAGVMRSRSASSWGAGGDG